MQRAAERVPGFGRDHPRRERQGFVAHVKDFGEGELDAAAGDINADRPDAGKHWRCGRQCICRGEPGDATAQAAAGPLQRAGELLLPHLLHAAIGEQHVPSATLSRR